MKTRSIGAMVAPFAALLLVVSCATTPPAQPAAAPPAAAPAARAVPDPAAERDKALALQKEITDYSLASYDNDTYTAGTADLAAGQDTYGKDNASSKASFLKAGDEFNAVIGKAVPLALAPDQQKADASRAAADAVKASVAVKDDYAAADQVAQAAVKEMAASDIASARRDFADAASRFDAAAAAAQAKKDAAQQALQAAQQAQDASQKAADDAVKSLQDDNITIPAAAAQGG